MDTLTYTSSIMPKIMAAVALINNPEILPSVRQRNFEILFRIIGNDVYNHIYDMAAFDFDIEHTTGIPPRRLHYSLAKSVSDSVSTGNATVQTAIEDFLGVSSSKARADAFATARESGKHPTVSRRAIGFETCKWCRDKEGDYIEPAADVFFRHENCDCAIITKGYKSRNGLLENYVKPKDR